MPVPVITFDIDGTLVNHQGVIHPNDITLLRQPPSDVLLVPNSGRTLPALRTALIRGGAFSEQERLPFPLVTQNGAVYLHCGERLAGAYRFDRPDQDALMELVLAHPEITTLISDAEHMFEIFPNEFSRNWLPSYGFFPLPYEQFQPSMRLVKVMLLSQRFEEMAEMVRQSQGIRAEVSSSMPEVVEFAPVGVSKASGLRLLLDSLDYSGSPVYAAGDGGNDMAMLMDAEMSFAPATGQPEILAVADEVIDVSRGGLLEPMLRAARGGQ